MSQSSRAWARRETTGREGDILVNAMDRREFLATTAGGLASLTAARGLLAQANDDPLGVRDDFPITRRMRFLATSWIGPMPRVVRDVACEYVDEKMEFADTRTRLEKKEMTRIAFAALFGAKPQEIALLYATTDGENIVTRGLDLTGAYGREPNDEPMKRFNPDGSTKDDFTDSVHGLRISNDGLVYVADRGNGRIQVFQKDGTYVDEHFIKPETRRGSSSGAVWDIELSNDEAQTYLYVADGTNQRVWTLQRDTMEVLDSFGRRGRGAGEFHWLHKFAIDSQGNFYTGEVHMQRRLQKFVPQARTAAN